MADREQSQADLPDIEQIPTELPLLAVRDIVLYPLMTVPLWVGRPASIAAVEAAVAGDGLMVIAAQRESGLDAPAPEDLHPVGTVASVLRVNRHGDEKVKVIVRGLYRTRIEEYLQTEPFFRIRHRADAPKLGPERAIELEALVRNVQQKIEQILVLRNLPREIAMVTHNVTDPGVLADLIATNLRLELGEFQTLLETFDPLERLKQIDRHLTTELEVSEVQQRIQNTAQEEISKSQREYVLREQLKAIQQELGIGEERGEEVDELRAKIEAAGMPEAAEVEARKQLRRLEGMHPDAAEANTIRTYLDWLVELPWSKSSKEKLSLPRARKILDEDHYDLEKVKSRILEHLAVRKLSRQNKGPILCLVGPPGVGKTSLGKSIARALGREFVRVSLGGMRDEAEMRGHRRTYIGALPGRIIQGIKTAATRNPVFMLDEIDKLGADFRGDPASALLEILDPAQNHAFADHYINLPFDLSQVMFIATANLVDPIPGPLLDRMEVIRLAGYTEDDKVQIAERYLVPRQIADNGLGRHAPEFDDNTLRELIRRYTREAGLRELERTIGSVCRKIALTIAEGRKAPRRVTPDLVADLLGPAKFVPEEELGHDEVGVALGLAWTSVGGEILAVEALVSEGTGQIVLTGQLGDVMKESARAAYSFARRIAKDWGFDPNFYKRKDVHVHVPAGAVPKDGPSAGVTIASALVSALAEAPVRKRIAMTGEITLGGRVLPIGGLKEKALAAHRVGVRELIVPKANLKDLPDIPEPVRKALKIHPVERVEEVLALALDRTASGRRKRGGAAKAAASSRAPTTQRTSSKRAPAHGAPAV